MKKVFILILFFISIPIVCAEEIKVEFSNCVDGDTAKFIYNNEEITARFLAIDTPETVHPTKEDEKHGKEASDYTCNKLKEAREIILEFDDESDRKDMYDRYLVWVFVDGKLLQEQIIGEGLANIAYIYGDYKYIDEIKKAEQSAKIKKIGIWSSEETTEVKDIKQQNNKENKITEFIKNYKEYIILIGSLIIVSIFNLKSEKKIKTKLKNKIKKDLKKRLK